MDRTGEETLATVRDALMHNRTFLVRGIALLRLAQLLLWPAGIVFGLTAGIENPALATVTIVLQTLWSLIWVTIVLSRNDIPVWSLWADVSINASAAVTAGLACYPWDALSWSNSAVPLAMGSMFSLALLFPARRVVLAWLMLSTGIGAGASVAMFGQPAMVTEYLSTLVMLLVVATLASLVGHRLRALAENAGRAAEALENSLQWRRAAEMQGSERTRQYRTLHDTVLSTLSALARGSLDASDPLVQRRCAADAEYLRSIISSADRSAANRLQGELAALGREQAVLGLRVHHQVADMPATVPEEVVMTIRDASREALNNVLKHSGQSQAWVTGRGDPSGNGGVTVTVTDRGRGFDTGGNYPGLGLSGSIIARMAEIGGSAVVESQTGQGTSVELRWPA
ncbi:ATP-binding protein [Arthrobacter sp. StoSoilB20]|uniref:sensor histidine kinase n=1 Tax=Arthrobacter sp. StoSoilB20 TaxID=2830995 RepID=UPI001CC45FB7|nr:ATP-binding protein [Arthrobacter sp. StoSoilB20]